MLNLETSFFLNVKFSFLFNYRFSCNNSSFFSGNSAICSLVFLGLTLEPHIFPPHVIHLLVPWLFAFRYSFCSILQIINMVLDHDHYSVHLFEHFCSLFYFSSKNSSLLYGTHSLTETQKGHPQQKVKMDLCLLHTLRPALGSPRDRHQLQF